MQHVHDCPESKHNEWPLGGVVYDSTGDHPLDRYPGIDRGDLGLRGYDHDHAPATTTTASKPGALEFVDGKLLGIAQGSLLTFAAEVLGLTPVPLMDQEFDPPIRACTGTPHPWVIRSGGLTLVFEGSSTETAILTNWTYTGGPAIGFTEIVAPYDIRIGDPRSRLEAANPDFIDYVDEIHVSTPFYLRYGVENNTVTWFGIIDCVFEESPTD